MAMASSGYATYFAIALGEITVVMLGCNELLVRNIGQVHLNAAFNIQLQWLRWFTVAAVYPQVLLAVAVVYH